MKKILLLVVLIGFFILVSVVGIRYVQHQQGFAPTEVTPLIISQINHLPTKVDSKIIKGGEGAYGNLSAEEKIVLQQYNDHLRSSLGDSSLVKAEDLKVEDLFLKYIDQDRILVGRVSTKGVSTLSLIGRRDWKDVGENRNSLIAFGGYIESDHYAISAGTNDTKGIYYYKAGDVTVRRIPNSELSSGETYQKEPGMGGGIYGISFDEQARTLTANVYESDKYGNSLGKKIRTATFVLD